MNVAVIKKVTKRQVDEISTDDHLFSLEVNLFLKTQTMTSFSVSKCICMLIWFHVFWSL